MAAEAARASGEGAERDVNGSVQSHWLHDALEREGHPEPAPPLRGTEKVDVCVVGGGFTGLWTAIKLKEREPTITVAVVEKDICGSGASGRNSGFLMSWWSKYPSLKQRFGQEQALELCERSADAVTAIPEFCAEHGIDAEFRHGGWVWVATSSAQLGAWDTAVEVTEGDGANVFELLSAEEARARSGSPTAVGGVFERTVGTIQPALLARGLRRVALESGVKLFEGTRMTRIDSGAPVTLSVEGGSVIADNVVLAMNAWAARWPEVRRAIVVVGTDVIVTSPVPDVVGQSPWGEGTAVSDSHRLVNALRSTGDGRLEMSRGGAGLIFRGRLDAQYDGRSPRVAELVSHLRRMYPNLPDFQVAASWRGPIDYSIGGLPWFGPVGASGNVFVGVGYSGNGVGPAYLGASMLVEQLINGPDRRRALSSPPSRALPPEPARYVGGNIVRKAVARKEAREDEDKPPRKLDTWLAGLDPTSFVD